MKKYHTLLEKADNVLDNVLRDLEPSFRTVLLDILVMEDLPINDLISKAKSALIPTNKRPIGKFYWLARGWPLAVAQAKIVDARKFKKPKISPYSSDFWIERVNPKTGQLFTAEEADVKRNSLRPIRAEYWLDKGFSVEDAVLKAQECKTANNKLGAEAVKNRNKDEIKSFSPRCKEYWLARGCADEEATKQVKNAQTTFSLKKCVDVHGKQAGKKKWDLRQEKWLKTMNSKSPEEIAEITRKKLRNKSGSISLGGKELAGVLCETIKIHEQIVIAASNVKRYIFDMGIGKKLIEYNGTYWHADPRKYNDNSIIGRKGLTAAEVWEKDRIKIDTAVSQGYEVLVIWESDFKENKQREIEKCLTFLQL